MRVGVGGPRLRAGVSGQERGCRGRSGVSGHAHGRACGSVGWTEEHDWDSPGSGQEGRRAGQAAGREGRCHAESRVPALPSCTYVRPSPPVGRRPSHAQWDAAAARQSCRRPPQATQPGWCPPQGPGMCMAGSTSWGAPPARMPSAKISRQTGRARAHPHPRAFPSTYPPHPCTYPPSPTLAHASIPSPHPHAHTLPVVHHSALTRRSSAAKSACRT